MNTAQNLHTLFSGVIGQEYELLRLMSPLSVEMSRLVGEAVAKFEPIEAKPTLEVLELGGGTGITTLAILSKRGDIHIKSVDLELTMQEKARHNLKEWIDRGQLELVHQDALSALKSLPDASQDIVASAYTLHNFTQDYRRLVFKEIWRVLKPQGQLITGDRFALDDTQEHTRLTQEEVRKYFKVLIPLEKFDVLENWIVHLMNDESINCIMRESTTLQQLDEIGFDAICLEHRQGVNALLTATKPGQ